MSDACTGSRAAHCECRQAALVAHLANWGGLRFCRSLQIRRHHPGPVQSSARVGLVGQARVRCLSGVRQLCVRLLQAAWPKLASLVFQAVLRVMMGISAPDFTRRNGGRPELLATGPPERPLPGVGSPESAGRYGSIAPARSCSELPLTGVGALDLRHRRDGFRRASGSGCAAVTQPALSRMTGAGGSGHRITKTGCRQPALRRHTPLG